MHISFMIIIVIQDINSIGQQFCLKFWTLPIIPSVQISKLSIKIITM